MSVTSTPGSAPKAMSSRLLTMKFMQRAANSSPTSIAVASPEEPSLKRRRTDSRSSSLQGSADSLADRNAVQTALAVEEAKRQAALEKQAAAAGDTRWVLSFEDQKHSVPPALALRIVQTGFANLDASPAKMRVTEEDETPVMVGRRSFGRFNKVLEKQYDPAFEDSEDSEDPNSEDEDEDEDDNQHSSEEADSKGDDSMDQMNQMIKQERKEAVERAKAQRKANKRAAREEVEQMARKRRKQDINLNTEVDLDQLTSLSGRQEAPLKKKEIECFRCGGPHLIRDCPTKKRSLGGDENLPPRKMKRGN